MARKLGVVRPKHRNHTVSPSQDDVGEKNQTRQVQTTSSSSYPQSPPIQTPPISPLGGGGSGKNIILNLAGTQMSVEALLEELEGCTRPVKKALLDGLALSLKYDSTGTSRDVEMWYHAVAAQLQTLLGSYFQNPNIKQIPVGWNFVQDFMASSGLDKCTVVQRSGVYRLLATMLVKHAQGVANYVGQPLTIKFTLSCCGAVPGLFDAAYPGYLESGLASQVVSAMKT